MLYDHCMTPTLDGGTTVHLGHALRQCHRLTAAVGASGARRAFLSFLDLRHDVYFIAPSLAGLVRPTKLDCRCMGLVGWRVPYLPVLTINPTRQDTVIAI